MHAPLFPCKHAPRYIHRRNTLLMYCLTLIVSDYPAKLSHEALPSQQVRAGT